jgi:hypothetical protein
VGLSSGGFRGEVAEYLIACTSTLAVRVRYWTRRKRTEQTEEAKRVRLVERDKSCSVLVVPTPKFLSKDGAFAAGTITRRATGITAHTLTAFSDSLIHPRFKTLTGTMYYGLLEGSRCSSCTRRTCNFRSPLPWLADWLPLAAGRSNPRCRWIFHHAAVRMSSPRHGVDS